MANFISLELQHPQGESGSIQCVAKESKSHDFPDNFNFKALLLIDIMIQAFALHLPEESFVLAMLKFAKDRHILEPAAYKVNLTLPFDPELIWLKLLQTEPTRGLRILQASANSLFLK